MQIDKNIPIPERTKVKSGVMAQMEIGDSVALPISTKGAAALATTVRAANKTAGFPDRKFVARTDDTEVRVWRVS